MKNEMSIESGADVESVWVAAFLDEQVDYPMHKTLSDDKRATYGSDAGVMKTMVRSKIKALILEEHDRVCAERALAQV